MALFGIENPYLMGLIIIALGIVGARLTHPIVKMVLEGLNADRALIKNLPLVLALMVGVMGVYGGLGTIIDERSDFNVPFISAAVGLDQPSPIESGGTTPVRVLDDDPTITVPTFDCYNQGTAIVTQNMWWPKDSKTRTDVAGAGTIQYPAGKTIMIALGIDSDDEAAEPYGPVIEHTIEYDERYFLTDFVDYCVENDALESDLNVVYYNNNDQLNTNNTLVAGNAYVYLIKHRGSSEEAYGNKYCGEASNIWVLRYNNTLFESMKATSLAGVEYVPAPVPDSLGTLTGYVQKAYYFPVLNNVDLVQSYVSLKVNTGVTPNSSYIYTYLFDSGLYIDDQGNQLCGVEDDNGVNIAAASYDTVSLPYNG